MSTYNLTVHDLNYTKQKITKQRQFLEKNSFITGSGQTRTLLDISMSANHSERYYSQLLNKIHTMDSYNIILNHVPIFMTVTLDAPFHEMLQGNFKKFYRKYKIAFGEIIELSTGEVIKNLVPNNDRYGYLIDAIEQERRLSVKELYRILSFQMHGFQRSYIFKKIKKDGNEVSYLRVTEPMKSGVPHFHLLLYTREEYIKGLYDSFHKYFSAPQNAKPLTYADNKRVCTKPLPDGTEETKGFQWDIKSATGYVLKYVLKSFRNVKNNEEIDFLQAWYINNRIPRIITSHTLVPQWVYHTMQVVDKDWFYQTELRASHFFECDSLNKKFIFHDYDYNRKFVYDNGLIMVFRNDRLFQSFGKKKNILVKIRLKSLQFTEEKPKTFILLRRYEIYQNDLTKRPMKEKCFDDDTKMMVSNGGLEFMLTFLEDLDEPIMEKIVSVSNMSNLTLLEFYRNKGHDLNDDIETVLSAKYLNIQNELSRRGLIDKPVVHLGNGTIQDITFVPNNTFLEECQADIFNIIKGLEYEE